MKSRWLHICNEPGRCWKWLEEGQRCPDSLACQGFGFVEFLESSLVDTGRQDLSSFSGAGKGPSLWVSSAKPKPWGLRLFLSSSRSPLPEAFEIAWEDAARDSAADAHQLWITVCYWLRCKFPTHQIVRSSKRSDLARSLSGSFLRVVFRYRGKDCLLIAADVDIGEAAHLAIGQALLWLAALTAKSGRISSR